MMFMGRWWLSRTREIARGSRCGHGPGARARSHQAEADCPGWLTLSKFPPSLVTTMSEGLPSVGAHCSLPSCNLNDFLPIRCLCHQLFCRDHIAPDVHSCPAQQVAQSTDAPSVKLLLALTCA